MRYAFGGAALLARAAVAASRGCWSRPRRSPSCSRAGRRGGGRGARRARARWRSSSPRWSSTSRSTSELYGGSAARRRCGRHRARRSRLRGPGLGPRRLLLDRDGGCCAGRPCSRWRSSGVAAVALAARAGRAAGRRAARGRARRVPGAGGLRRAVAGRRVRVAYAVGPGFPVADARAGAPCAVPLVAGGCGTRPGGRGAGRVRDASGQRVGDRRAVERVVGGVVRVLSTVRRRGGGAHRLGVRRRCDGAHRGARCRWNGGIEGEHGACAARSEANVTRTGRNRGDVTFASLSAANVTSGPNGPRYVTFSSPERGKRRTKRVKSGHSDVCPENEGKRRNHAKSGDLPDVFLAPRRNRSGLFLNAAVLQRNAHQTRARRRDARAARRGRRQLTQAGRPAAATTPRCRPTPRR